MGNKPTELGIISDTHGLVRPDVQRALAGVERIIHAGDAGKPGVLEALRTIAPVTAVRGNVDYGDWAEALPATEVVEAGAVSLYVLHVVELLDLDPAAAGFAAVISGHSHRPSIEDKDGVLYLNPGAAGPRRFRLPTTVMRLRIEGGRLFPKLIHLEVEA